MMKTRIFLLFVVLFLLLGSSTGILAEEEIRAVTRYYQSLDLETLPLLYSHPTGLENVPSSELQEKKALFDEQLHKEPENYALLALRSMLNEALGDSDAVLADTKLALEYIEQGTLPMLTAEQTYAMKALCLWRRSIIQFELGQYQQSIDSMDQLLEKGLEILDLRGLRLNAAICNIRLGRTDAALMHCIHALDDTSLDVAEDQTASLTYHYLVLVASKLRGLEKPLFNLTPLSNFADDLREDPGNIQARLDRATILYAVGAEKNAQKDCEYIISEYKKIQEGSAWNQYSQDEQAQWHDWFERANIILSSILETQESYITAY